jgi:ABC-type Na+ transport system ATPase subunit NatA
MILFGGFAVIGTSWFIKFLKSVESQLVATLNLDAGASGGATAALWKSDFFRSMIVHMVGDRDLAESLLQFTPIGLYFGWLSMTFAPWLVAQTSSARVTEEIWSGSARFVLCRTTRLAWVLGKYLGQSLQLLAALALCVAASWLTGRIMLESFDGAGKTTMMSICAGLLRADGGRVDLLGEGAFDPARHAGRVTILPQDSRLPLHARVADLLMFYGRLQGVPRADLPAQIEQLLAWVNLSDRATSPVKSLSHGMMRRLTVAQAFLGQPQLIFLDEPMSGLDPREVARMRETLGRRRDNQTIVIRSRVLTEL